MRDFLFKPIHLPGFPQRKPQKRHSWQFTLMLMAGVVGFTFVLLAGVYATTFAVTFIWTITAEPTPKSIEEMPLWTIPVCILTPIFVVIAIAWRFKVVERFARLIKEKDRTPHV